MCALCSDSTLLIPLEELAEAALPLRPPGNAAAPSQGNLLGRGARGESRGAEAHPSPVLPHPAAQGRSTQAHAGGQLYDLSSLSGKKECILHLPPAPSFFF